MSVLLAAVAAALALSCVVGPTARPRLSALSRQWRPPTPRRNAERHPGSTGGRRRLPTVSPRAAACLVGAVGAAALVEGAAGVVVGGCVGAGAWAVTGRLEPLSHRRRREALQAAVPLGVDLLAACLSSGRPPTESVAVVAEAAGGALGEELAVIAARLSLGADPVAVWRGVGEGDTAHPLAPMARVMARSLETGAPAADGLTRLADDLRRERRAAVDQAARSVGVRATAPLGLCFLPAFVLIGIVPAVVSVFVALDLW